MEEKKHVQFNIESIEDEDDREQDDVIQALYHSDHVFTVKLGYIKIFHRYRVFFCLSNEILKNTMISLPENEEVNSRCIYIKSKDIYSGVRVEVELYAENEHTFQEKMILQVNHKTNQSIHEVTIWFLASVFGKHEGTPRLKRGIHCVGYEDIDSTSSSDAG